MQRILGCRNAALLQKLPLRRSAKSSDPLRAAVVPLASCRIPPRFSQGGREDGRRERIFRFGGPNQKIFPSRIQEGKGGGGSKAAARAPQFSPLLVLPSSRPPCEKISIVRSGLDTPGNFCDSGCS